MFAQGLMTIILIILCFVFLWLGHPSRVSKCENQDKKDSLCRNRICTESLICPGRIDGVCNISRGNTLLNVSLERKLMLTLEKKIDRTKNRIRVIRFKNKQNV